MELRISFKSYFIRWNRKLVDIDNFTKYLKTFQKIIYLLAQSGGYLSNIKDSRFLIKKIEKGSIDCVIESYYISRHMLGIDPIKRIIDDFTEVSNLIDIGDEKRTYKKLSEKIPDMDSRKTLYGYYESIIPDENNAFQIYKKEEGKEDKRIFSSKTRYRNKIKTWKEFDSAIKERFFIGVIKSLNAYYENKKFVKIIDNLGKKIQYNYKEEEKEKITKLYDSDIIKIAGKYDPTQKRMVDLTVFEKVNEIVLHKLKNLEFLNPIKIQLEYDFGNIYCSNKEFNLHAMGDCYNNMINDLYSNILETIEMFLDPALNFIETSKNYREKFLNQFKLIK